MALFGFRTRNPQRDRDTDAGRYGRLLTVIEELKADMERERNGLRDRYESITMQAAFSQQALEDDRAGPDMSSTIDELTETMSRYTRRIESLVAQIEFVTSLHKQVDGFSQQSQGAALSSQKSIPPGA